MQNYKAKDVAITLNGVDVGYAEDSPVLSTPAKAEKHSLTTPISHMNKAFQPEKLISDLSELVDENSYDVVCGTGLSGVIAATTIAVNYGKRLLCVRKEGESSHSHKVVEGFVRADDRVLFVDDIIDSGATIRRLSKIVSSIHPSLSFVGVFLYTGRGYMSGADNDASFETDMYLITGETKYLYTSDTEGFLAD